ncbi:MAG: UDP-glucose 6-dehydrogenase [Pseudarthrobacter sp.]|nr:UDP-glucose 6-dehydrogenase [Pseudarthrobacter sp.]
MLLLTEWDEYRQLSPGVAGSLVRRRVVLDARNALDAVAWQSEGWVVRGLGTSADPMTATQLTCPSPATEPEPAG